MRMPEPVEAHDATSQPVVDEATELVARHRSGQVDQRPLGAPDRDAARVTSPRWARAVRLRSSSTGTTIARGCDTARFRQLAAP
jgi:hypothetical protein